MIHGYALISINHEGKGKFYDLNEGQKALTFLDFHYEWSEVLGGSNDEEIAEMLTPDNQKDVLLMVFFSYHFDKGMEVDDYEDWLEIESFQVLQENHEKGYLQNLQMIVGLYDSNAGREMDVEYQELMESEKERLNEFIGEYEEFYDKEFVKTSEPEKVEIPNLWE